MEITKLPIIVTQKGFLLIHLLIATVILIGAGYLLLNKSTQDKPILSSPVVSTSTNILQSERKIPTDIEKMLPIKSPDGKDIKSFYLSTDDNYLVFSTFVENAGAGPKNDYWLLNRSTGEKVNLSKNILKDSVYLQTYKDDYNFKNGLQFLSFNNLWLDKNPVFEVTDGWQIVGDYWEYDLTNNKFINHKRNK